MGGGGYEGKEGEEGEGGSLEEGGCHWEGGDEKGGRRVHYRYHWEGGGFIGWDSSGKLMFHNKYLFLHHVQEYFVNTNLMQVLVSI